MREKFFRSSPNGIFGPDYPPIKNERSRRLQKRYPSTILYAYTLYRLQAYNMFASYLSIESVQRQVAVMSRELHLARSQSHPSLPVIQLFFLHQLDGLGKTWTVYRDSLMNALHSCSLSDHGQFEPGSVAYHDMLRIILETHSHAIQANQVIVWLVSLRDNFWPGAPLMKQA